MVYNTYVRFKAYKLLNVVLCTQINHNDTSTYMYTGSSVHQQISPCTIVKLEGTKQGVPPPMGGIWGEGMPRCKYFFCLKCIVYGFGTWCATAHAC